ncbi:HPr family phosphocarrier protein [Georgenia sp. Z1344]|uniref:HPr family phosphocarrier protein n=1 Tax=Georgenia sp. Z1344 TaxID=3416706 RepID=UPI003CE9A731
MPQRSVIVASEHGLHARPAQEFVAAATASGAEVTISKVDGAPVSASSILSVMSLGVKQGDTVVLAAEGEGADEAVDSLATRLENPQDN